MYKINFLLKSLITRTTRCQTVEFVEVEAEDHPDLCNKLNITSVPVVIFFKSGVEIERLTGGNVRHYAAKVALNRVGFKSHFAFAVIVF